MPAAESVADYPTPSRPLLLATLAWGLGILADRYAGMSLLTWWSTAVVLVAIAIALRHLGRHQSFAGTLLVTLACTGGAWHHLHWNFAAHDELGRFARETSQPVCFEGVAIDRIKWSPAPTPDPLRAMPLGPMSEVLVRVTRVRDGQQWREVSGSCRLRVAGGLADVTAGDRLRAFALFGRIPPALNPGQYDWAQAERRAARYCDLYCRRPECITVIEPAAVSPISRWIDLIRQRCEWRLMRYVGPENCDLALAVLLGERERLEDATTEAFLGTGTVHLLVVSGLHVGILAFAIWAVVCSGFLSRRWGLLITALLVIVYAAIAGGRPPVIRATVLILLGLSSLLLARRAAMTNLLAVAALVVLIYNPGELFRGGTQLSFLCVAVLASFGQLAGRGRPPSTLQRMIREYAPWHRRILRWTANQVGQLTLASLMVWIVAAPLVAHHFHIATPIGIAITPIIWPLIAVSLITGLSVCAFGWLFPPLGYLLGATCSWCLGTTESIVSAAIQLNLGSLYCPGPPLWWLWGFYVGLGLVALLPRLREGWSTQLALAALWIACGFAVAASRSNTDRLHCTFLAVGHGTCVVLELPGNQTILYDAGSLGSPSGASRTVAAYLWSRGITRIDAIVLSHADIDHYNAVPGLLERFEIGMVYVSPRMFEPPAPVALLTAPNPLHTAQVSLLPAQVSPLPAPDPLLPAPDPLLPAPNYLPSAPDYLRRTLADAGVPLREVWSSDRLRVAHPEVEIEILHPPRAGVPGSDNANSILLRMQYAGHQILLPGDLESPGLEEVTAGRPLDIDILLAPHHGSANSDPAGFAAWCTPRWTVASGRHHDQDFELTEISYREVGSKILHTAECGAAQFTLTKQTIEVSTFRQR